MWDVMFSSTIIPTIGRPSLSRVVWSVLNQQFDRGHFEVIVVNDSGQALQSQDWHSSKQVRILNTHRRERCVARNAGAAVAKGEYLHFIDDDDWLLPGALQNLWELAQLAPEAAWLFGGSQLMDRNGDPIIELHHEMSGNCFIQVLAGEWIPLQSSIIKSGKFFNVGGFHPLIPGIEDIDLVRRIALTGDMEESPATIACITMGIEGSATNYQLAQEHGRRTREAVLDDTRAFRRMIASANNSYWYGRILRAYLTSTMWNLERRKIFTVFSRLLQAIQSILYAKSHVIAPPYWQAVLRKYESDSFLRSFKDAKKPIRRRVIKSK